MNVWIDGICCACGCIVVETGSTMDYADYQNSCTNPRCKNFGWHHNGDMEFQQYFIHKQDGNMENFIPEHKG